MDETRIQLVLRYLIAYPGGQTRTKVVRKLGRDGAQVVDLALENRLVSETKKRIGIRGPERRVVRLTPHGVSTYWRNAAAQ